VQVQRRLDTPVLKLAALQQNSELSMDVIFLALSLALLGLAVGLVEGLAAASHKLEGRA
jgi:hypothetical protein